MFLARIVFFRLHESPRFLVHAGRLQEAVESLQMISRFNGSALSLELDDVRDHHHKPVPEHPIEGGNPISQNAPGRPAAIIFNATEPEDEPHPTPNSVNGNGHAKPALVTQYSATDTSPSRSPRSEAHPHVFASSSPSSDKSNSPTLPSSSPPRGRSPQRIRPRSALARRNSFRSPSPASSIYKGKVCYSFPRTLSKPMRAWWNQVAMVLSPEWFRTSILVWGAWFFMSLGSYSHFASHSLGYS